jgi:hypothetical protein
MKPVLCVMLLVQVVTCFSPPGEKRESARSAPVQESGALSGIAGGLDCRMAETRLDVISYCLNPTDREAELRYELLSTKTGPSGRADSRQSSSFTILPQEKKTLSRFSINCLAEDAVRIRLRIYRGEELLDEKIVSSPIDRWH